MAKLKNKNSDCPGDDTIGKVIDFISKTDQEKIKIAKAFLYPLIRLLNIGLKYVAKKKTPYKYAVTEMVRHALSSTGNDHEYFIDFSKIILSRGNLTAPQVEDVHFSGGKCSVQMSDNSGEGDAKPDDISMLLFYNVSKLEFICYLQGSSRSTASQQYDIPEHWAGDVVHAYITMKSADGKLVSDSQYLGDYIAN